MNKLLAILLASTVAGAGLAGCEMLPTPKEEPPVADVVGSSHSAADALMLRAANSLQVGETVIAASFVNVDDLEQSSSFGRIISQQVSSQFANRGYRVVEMLLRNNVYIKQGGGEFLLSREVRNLSLAHNAQAVIVGTYAMGRKNILVTAKLIRATDSVVLSSVDYSLPIDPDVGHMLRSK